MQLPAQTGMLETLPEALGGSPTGSQGNREPPAQKSRFQPKKRTVRSGRLIEYVLLMGGKAEECRHF